MSSGDNNLQLGPKHMKTETWLIAVIDHLLIFI